MRLSLKIYLISLEQDHKRRLDLAERFHQTYLKMQWIKAVNGKELSSKEYFSYVRQYFKNHQKIITPSEVGCTLSHIKALETFLETDDEYCLILEDDVRGQDQDIEKLIKFFSNTSLKGIFLLRDQNNFGFNKYIFGRKIFNFYEIPRFSIQFMFGSCAYIIDRESAGAVLEHHKKSFEITDAWLRIVQGAKAKFYYSPVFIHPEDLSHSHIENERANFYTYEKNFFKRVYEQGIFLEDR